MQSLTTCRISIQMDGCILGLGEIVLFTRQLKKFNGKQDVIRILPFRDYYIVIWK